ncbi:MAG: hypothetical protein A2942_04985 [Candidatus Lloydbacteria bacterium RIFCSPLOWO2_01_FULL_50_20]|uniref:Uncharacterized protein n=1 Tax=Candidatus Lloydbacteria bacterium RIFCSPLOWO2_01_FULL_50_20 TaxID=1798665 RepID=A0A1G2DJC5_9BACT|nr:MAG: hypothetical protein A3C13_00490 [Candidatus Lloydbacteria bacterium RIFCSPHIGHO2_02_FULL_50_11]OGZ12918.1 MAG: hypothetical protein A2942_04985 [Candidatus Lloydbacteria bacterium RIFCSPLOWO2_01_FULL_50_20]
MNLFTPSLENFGYGFEKNPQYIPIDLRFFSSPRSKFSATYVKTFIVDGIKRKDIISALKTHFICTPWAS